MHYQEYHQCVALGFRQILLVRHQSKLDDLSALDKLLDVYPAIKAQASCLLVLEPNSALAGLADSSATRQLCRPGQSKAYLGQEFERLVLDANQLRADDLAICSGLLPAGGVCVLLLDATQPMNAIAQRLLKACAQIDLPVWQEFTPSALASAPQGIVGALELTPDDSQQQKVVAALVKNALGRARRPLLVSADRGRGKTAALGLAAAQLLPQLNPAQRILIVAKQLEAVQTAFEFARQGLSQGSTRVIAAKGRLQLGDNTLAFVLASELFATDIGAQDIVWIDEAASLPVALLKQALLQFKRVVFVSTVQGYEGTGKGFELKFKPFLQRHSQQWRQLTLTQPLRWQAGDPLEKACQQALLLDASVELEASLQARVETPAMNTLADTRAETRFERVTMADFYHPKNTMNEAQERQLKQVWALLSLAHYQTSPMDLQLLLDDESMQLLLAYQADELVAVVLFKQEGEISGALAEQIALAKRRPKGHLLPQVFASQLGLTDALGLKAWRIIRIATRMDKTRQGFASQLLQQLQNLALVEKIDYLGSSFAASADVIQFWRHNDYLPIHLGRQKDQASGCYSLAVSLPLGSLAAELSERAYRHFHQTWPSLLNEYWQDLDNPSLLALARQDQFKAQKLDDLSLQQVELFSQHKLSFEAAFGALAQMLVLAMAAKKLDNLSANEQDLLINKILRNQNWARLSQDLNLSGKKACLQQLQASLAKISL